MTVYATIAQDIHILVEPLEGRALTLALIVGDRGAVLVDTGVAETPARLVVPALAELGLGTDDVRQIVITHSDIDHSGGLGAMRALAPSATVLAHRLDVRWIEQVEALIDERYRGRRHEHAIDVDDAFVDWVRRSDTHGTVDVAVTGGELIRIGGNRELELVHVPGHSNGHLAVVDRTTGTGLIGDAVFGAVTPLLDGTGAFAPGYYDAVAYRATIARLRAFGLERIVGSHYPVLEGPAVAAFLDESEVFADRLEGALLEGLERARGRGLTLLELVEETAPAVRAWPVEDDSSISVAALGHLIDLEERGLVRRAASSPTAWTRT